MIDSIKYTSDALFALFQGMEEMSFMLAKLDPFLNKDITKEQWLKWAYKTLENHEKEKNIRMPDAWYS